MKSGEVGGCKDDEREKFSYGSGIDCFANRNSAS